MPMTCQTCSAPCRGANCRAHRYRPALYRTCRACGVRVALDQFDARGRRCTACKAARRNAPARRHKHTICPVCCNLSHRVVGPRCKRCRRVWAPDRTSGEVLTCSPIAAMEEM